MSKARQSFAIAIGIAICVLTVTPFALAINRFDWGVGLLLVAPLLVWLLLRMGRRLERWSRDETDIPLPDPDYPEDSL
ncbi:MAG: hypothetical protein R3F50_11875 [Gammaproteobacteria bacterium]